MLSVHRGKVFGVAGEMVFMLAALALPLQCTTGYLLYMDRRRKKARARAARLTECPPDWQKGPPRGTF